MSRWSTKSRVAISVTLGIALGLGGAELVEPRLPTSPTLRGMRLDGEPLPVGRDARALVENKASQLAARVVTLYQGEHRYEVTLDELGVVIDVEATVADVLAKGHTGSWLERLREADQARRGEIDVPLVMRMESERAEAFLRTIADELTVASVDAELDLENHRKIPDQPGLELDVEGTVAAIRESAVEVDAIPLVMRRVSAKTTLADLDDIDVSKVLSKFETRFSVWKKGRSANVRLATQKLNGLVVRPLQTVSFNERVGPRTTEAGFQQAPEIVGDELTIGIGGGTCQVSSTLHGAAIHGGLSVVKRRSHSRPSSYTLLGLDATVAYPKVDLKLKNPYDFPIVIHAFEPEDGLLRVEILGGEAVESVHYSYGISGVEDYVRRITVQPWMKNRAFRKQKGTRGMDVFSVVLIKYLDGRTEQRRYFSGYRATPEVYWVSPDYEDELPELPKHAKGIEGRLHEDGSDIYPVSG